MNGFSYGIFEYLAWVGVVLLLLILVFACLAIGLAVSSAVNPLAEKWKLTSTGKHPPTPEPARIRRPTRFHSLRVREFFHTRKSRGKARSQGASADSK